MDRAGTAIGEPEDGADAAQPPATDPPWSSVGWPIPASRCRIGSADARCTSCLGMSQRAAGLIPVELAG